MSSPIIIEQIWSSKTVVKNTSETYDFNLARSDGYEGFFSLHVQIVSGTGVLTIDFLESNDGTNFVDQGANSDMVTGLTGAGHYMYSFDPMVCKKIRIRATETGTSADVVISAWLAAQ